MARVSASCTVSRCSAPLVGSCGDATPGSVGGSCGSGSGCNCSCCVCSSVVSACGGAVAGGAACGLGAVGNCVCGIWAGAAGVAVCGATDAVCPAAAMLMDVSETTSQR